MCLVAAPGIKRDASGEPVRHTPSSSSGPVAATPIDDAEAGTAQRREKADSDIDRLLGSHDSDDDDENENDSDAGDDASDSPIRPPSKRANIRANLINGDQVVTIFNAMQACAEAARDAAEAARDAAQEARSTAMALPSLLDESWSKGFDKGKGKGFNNGYQYAFRRMPRYLARTVPFPTERVRPLALPATPVLHLPPHPHDVLANAIPSTPVQPLPTIPEDVEYNDDYVPPPDQQFPGQSGEAQLG